MYAHDSCISVINLLVRDNVMNVFLVMRSSETRTTLSYDLRFVTNVISEVESFTDVDIDRRILNIQIHSAHIIN